jgi:cytochrome c peroxidase
MYCLKFIKTFSMTITRKITTAVFFMAVSALFLSATIDLNNLQNYSNQPVPSHILPTLDNIPATNPMDDKIATLGRVLFYDKHLSSNNTVACAGCHQQENAFGLLALQGTGVNGLTLRRPMRLLNLRYKESIEGFFWDERSPDLEDLATRPVHDHLEMGYSGTGGDPGLNDMLTKLQGLSYYNTLFTFAYGDNAVTKTRVEKALAQFLRSIQSYDSKFDAGM